MRAACAIFLLGQAAKYRQLAIDASDKDLSVRLLQLAADYEERAEMQRDRPSDVADLRANRLGGLRYR